MSSLESKVSETLSSLELEIIKGNTRVDYYPIIKNNLLGILESQESSEEEKIRSMLLLGRVEENNNKPESALSYFSKAVEESTKIKNLVLIFYSYYRRTFHHRYVSNHQEMLEDFEKTKEIYETIKLEKKEDFIKEKLYYEELAAQVEYVNAFIGKEIPENFFKTVFPKIKEWLEIAKELNDPEMIQKLLNHAAYLNHGAGNDGEFFKYAKKMVEHANKIGNNYWLIWGYSYISGYYERKGDNEKKFEYYLKISEIYKNLEDKDGIADHDYRMGLHYLNEYKYNLALKHLESVYNYYKSAEGDHKKAIVNCSMSLGMVHRAMGNLDTAIEYLVSAYDYFNEKKPENWWYILPPLSSVYLLKGELDRALELQEEQLALQKKMEYIPQIASALIDIGEILWQKGLRKEALEKTIEGLNISNQTDIKISTFRYLVSIIYYLTELDETDKAKDYLKQLESIVSEIDDKEVKYKSKYAEALVLRKSSDEKEKLRAEILLEDLLKDDLNYNFHISVILAYTELLITNLQTSGEEKILLKLHKFSSHLFSLATTNKSYTLTVEALLLQSKLALVDLDTKRAKQLIDQSLEIAEEKGLAGLKEKIAEEQKVFAEETGKMQNLKSDSPLSIRVEAIDFKKTMNGVKKAGVTQKQVETAEVSKKLFTIQI